MMYQTSGGMQIDYQWQITNTQNNILKDQQD